MTVVSQWRRCLCSSSGTTYATIAASNRGALTHCSQRHDATHGVGKDGRQAERLITLYTWRWRSHGSHAILIHTA